MAECTEDQLMEFTNIVRDYTASRLLEDGLVDRGDVQRIVGPFVRPDCPAMQTLKIVANRINAEHKEVFDNMCSRLDTSQETLYGTFRDVARELFLGKINWGRIVAFVAFSGALSAHCAKNNMSVYIPEITEWTAHFMKEELSKWISAEGGWGGFRDHFQHQPFPFLGAGIFLLVGALLVGGIFQLSRILSPA